MSYCRWSCLNHQSHVYVYEAQDGFIIHVAAREIVCEDDPPSPPQRRDFGSAQSWTERLIEHGKRIEPFPATSKRHPIGLPHDGETFVLPSAKSCAGKLRELAGMGYKVPGYAIGRLEAEFAG